LPHAAARIRVSIGALLPPLSSFKFRTLISSPELGCAAVRRYLPALVARKVLPDFVAGFSGRRLPRPMPTARNCGFDGTAVMPMVLILPHIGLKPPHRVKE
jgi:hypothetical protein